MQRIAILIIAVLLAGCANTKLGAILYCPHGQTCELRVSPPVELPAS